MLLQFRGRYPGTASEARFYQDMVVQGYTKTLGDTHNLTVGAKSILQQIDNALEQIEQQMMALPQSLSNPSHPHALNKLAHVYDGSYGCDICSTAGQGWVYHCEECGFDAHPCCVCVCVGTSF